MSEQEKRGELVKIGALWTGRTKDGDLCLTGRMGDAVLLVFKNKFKQEEKQPDYIAYVARPSDKKGDGPKDSKAQSLFDEERLRGNPPVVDADDDDDEIPF